MHMGGFPKFGLLGVLISRESYYFGGSPIFVYPPVELVVGASSLGVGLNQSPKPQTLTLKLP